MSFVHYRFPTFKPSIAFLILDNSDKHKNLKEMIDRLSKFQSAFKDCNVLIVGKQSEQYWQRAQYGTPAGLLNFIFVETESAGACEIRNYLRISNDTKKTKRQLEFFAQVCFLISICFYRRIQHSISKLESNYILGTRGTYVKRGSAQNP
jgi:hypothetical protein